MKLVVNTPENSIHPLIGAKIIFSKHSEKNKNHSYAHHWVDFGKVYEVVNYSDYPGTGDGPMIICKNGTTGDVPMSELDYDIISEAEPTFNPVTIVLESQEEVAIMCDVIGDTAGTFGLDCYRELCGLIEQYNAA